MITTWSSEDHRAYRIGAAIRDICIAFGGWMDWGSDGKVRFLCRGPDGSIGIFFPDWIISGMKQNREAIRRYVELVREKKLENERRREALGDKLKNNFRRPRG